MEYDICTLYTVPKSLVVSINLNLIYYYDYYCCTSVLVSVSLFVPYMPHTCRQTHDDNNGRGGRCDINDG